MNISFASCQYVFHRDFNMFKGSKSHKYRPSDVHSFLSILLRSLFFAELGKMGNKWLTSV